jgi:hypothetical protein
MRSINAVSLTKDVNEWVAQTHQPRFLQIFEQACNLINEHRNVLSIVTPEIGNGPFNLVLEEDVTLSKKLSIESPISVETGKINLGDLSIKTISAKIWNPRPDWEILHEKRYGIIGQLTARPIPHDPPSIPKSLLATLSSAIANADIDSSITSAKRLAGLGNGLTPAGDDFLMGAIHAAWILHPPQVAKALADAIANTAAPLTTSLSAAWLRCAGRGGAGILWHELFDALFSANESYIQNSTNKILAVGETSGADALAGFINVLKTLEQPGRSKTH